MSQENKDKEKARNVRRAAKGALTRAINTGKIMLNAKRLATEMYATVKQVKDTYDNLGNKHDDYTMFLDNTEYDEAEKWMEQCTREYTEFMITVNEYEKIEALPGPQNVVENTPDTENDSTAVDNHEVQQEISEMPEQIPVNSGPVPSKPHMLKHEKPKLPQFHGDIRKYFIFKADFQHTVESHCSERDAITILRSCLRTEPSKLVEGISTDVKIMWQYLDQNYGDPRIISDTVTADLEKFKTIQPGEDHRFCELVNLVRRSYNILKEIQRPQILTIVTSFHLLRER